MNTRNLIMLMGSSLSAIVSGFLSANHASGVDFFRGVSTGFMIALLIELLPKFIKKKNEATSK